MNVKRVIKFGFVGGFIMVLGAVILSLLIESGVDQPTANFIQAIVSIELNFLLNNWLTWRDRRHSRLWVRFAKYHAGKLVTIPTNQLMFILLTTVGVHYLVAYFINIGVVMAVNYLLYELFVFKEKNGPNQNGPDEPTLI